MTPDTRALVELTVISFLAGAAVASAIWTLALAPQCPEAPTAPPQFRGGEDRETVTGPARGEPRPTSFIPRDAFRKAQTTAHDALPGTRWPKPGPTGFAAQAPYKAGQRPTGAA